MTRSAAGALLPLVLLAGGCVYLNSLYNARETFDAAEADRWAGRYQEAAVGYDSVVAKAARSFRRDPEGEWADDALYLLGRAYLRQGDLANAGASLHRAMDMTTDEELRRGVVLHLGMVSASGGDYLGAVGYLNEALRGIRSDRLLGEGHLWRARVLLHTGQPDAGWWDLDRAVEAHRRYEIPAGLERVAWGAEHRDTARVAQGVRILLQSEDGHLRADTLRGLLERVAREWSPAFAADVLQPLEDSGWPRDAQERFLLERARLRIAAGDTVRGIRDANAVSMGVGPEAVTARLMVADLGTARAETVGDLGDLRNLLLPGVGDGRVLARLESLRLVELLEERGRSDPDALFAAAELARDRLAAPKLARGLFLRYAEEGTSIWVGKAALAALALSRTPIERRDPLRLLARLRNNPYVTVLERPGPIAVDLAALDADLQARLTPLMDDAMIEAAQLDVLVRERSDTTGRWTP